MGNNPFVFLFLRETIRNYCLENRLSGLFESDRDTTTLSDNAEPVYLDLDDSLYLTPRNDTQLDDPVYHPTPEYDQPYNEGNLKIHDYQNNPAGGTENDGMEDNDKVYYSTPARNINQSYQNVGYLENEDSDGSKDILACKNCSDCSSADGSCENPGFELDKQNVAAIGLNENIEKENLKPDQESYTKATGTLAITLYNDNVPQSATKTMAPDPQYDIKEMGTVAITDYTENVSKTLDLKAEELQMTDFN